jgi:hypothetical protein
MPNNIWSAAGVGNWSTNGNWSLGVAPVLADDVIFNNTSVQNCTIDVSPTVNSITFAANYSGNWTAVGQTMTCTLGFSHDGTGTSNFGNGMTCNGLASTFHVGAGVGTVTATSCVLTMNGTTGMILDEDKGVFAFKSLTLGASAKVTISGAATNSFRSTSNPLILGNNSTLTINKTTYFILSATANWHSIGTGCTINGSFPIFFAVDANSITCSLPTLTYTGTGLINILEINGVRTGVTIQLAGNLTATSGNVALRAIAASTVTTNLNNYNISCSYIMCGGAAGATFTILFGNGSHSFGTFDGFTYNNAGTTISFQTCQIIATSAWTFGSNHTVNPGTFLVTITNTSTITSNGKSFFDLTINAAAKTITMADALICAAGGDLTVTAGTLTTSIFNLTVGGDVSITGTLTVSGSTCSFGGNYTTAAASTININAATNYTFTAVTVVTTNGKALPQCTFNNNFSINDTCTITRLIFGVDGFTGTFEAGQTFTITNLVAANWSGALGARNAVRSSVPGTQFTLALPNAATLTYWDSRDCIYQGFEITANDGTSITYGNNLNLNTFNVVTVVPALGASTGGTVLAFADTGNGFGGAMNITIDGVPMVGIAIVGAQNCNATTAGGNPGPTVIVVTNGDGDQVTLVGQFTYLPLSGGAAGGASRCYISASIGV